MRRKNEFLKRIGKTFAATVMTISMLATSFMPASGVAISFAKSVGALEIVSAATTATTAYSGNNVNRQNYTTYGSVMKSYLVKTSSGYMRFQSDAVSGKYLVEYYNSNFAYVSAKEIDAELSLFGGFYSDGSNYYVVSGQANPSESNDVEVYRITKYDTSWKRLGSTGLYGANTYYPFSSGSCRMTHDGSLLFIRTCHTMYTSSDGYNHQANVTIEVDTSAMKVVGSLYAVASVSSGYSSHSFTEFIRLDGGKIVAVDHGDAYPRAIGLFKYKNAYSATSFSPSTTYVDMVKIPGEIGANATGASAGGFEVSSTSYLVAGNMVDMSAGSSYSVNGTRNVFVSVLGKSDTTPTLKMITEYPEGDTSASTPQLVKLSDTSFLLLWMKDAKLYYCKLDQNGDIVGSIYRMQAELSDCQPIVNGTKVVWYTWSGTTVTFYEIDSANLGATGKEELCKVHDYQIINATATDNIAKKVCSQCGDTISFTTLDRFYVWWWTGMGGSSAISSTANKGDVHRISMRTATPSDAENQELVLESSDESVMTVKNDTFTFVGEGDVTLTIYAKYRPTTKITQKFTVPHNLDTSTTVNVSASTCTTHGQTKTYCNSCGKYIYTDLPLDANNHTGETVIKNAKEATCSTAGFTGDTYCKGCDKKLSSGTTIAATGKHSYDNGVVTTAPTCNATGVKTYTCTVCKATKTEEVAMNPSNHVAETYLVGAKEAGCGVDGYTGDTYCKDCHEIVSSGNAIAATGKHVLDDGIVTRESSCITKGIIIYSCKNCSYTKQEDLPVNAKNHIGETYFVGRTDAACGQPGYTGDLYCSDCKKMIEAGTQVNALEHALDSGVETLAATCVVAGNMHYHCTRCDYETDVEIAPLGHAYTEMVIAPTCTEQGYTVHSCIRCEDTYNDTYVDALGHAWEFSQTLAEATCAEEGTDEYYCSACGEIETRSVEVLDHVEKATTTPATITANGAIHYNCEVCGAQLRASKTIYMPKTVTLSVTKCTYTGKAKKPTVVVKDSKGNVIDAKYYTVKYYNNVNVGTATVKVYFKGRYAGVLKKTFNINPKGTSISSVTAKSKGFAVKWKKQATQTTGYQIRYSTSSKMTSAKAVTISKNTSLSKTVKNLKGRKTYYVQVRTYKKVGTKKYYSAWSTKKKVVTLR